MKFLVSHNMSVNQDSKILENQWSIALQSPSSRDSIWVELHNYFSGNPKNDFNYRLTFFRWYSFLTWKRVALLSSQDFVNIAIGRQVVMALLLGFDPLSEFFDYINLHSWSEQDKTKIFSDAQDAFINSSEIIGFSGKTAVLLRDAVLEIKKSWHSNSSLEKAETKSKIKRIIFSSNDSDFTKYISVDPEQVVDKFFDLVEFFLTVKSVEITSIAEEYSILDFKSYSENSESRRVDNKGEKNDLLKKIKVGVEEKVKKNKKGEFDNIEDVFKELDRLANENGDDRIRELYYFNEKTGKFEWNEELLKSSES